jgi:HSP20 family protein
MAITEKVKEKLDDASKELRDTVDGLRKQVERLSDKVKDKLKDTSGEMKETVEDLAHEVKELKEKVADLIPRRRRTHRLPVSVSQRDPQLNSLAELQQTADRLFEDLFRASGGTRRATWDIPMTLPSDAFSTDWLRVEMCERGQDVQVTVELPGVDKKDVEISLDRDRLTLRGEKKSEQKRKGRNYYHVERYYGGFHRSILLPCEVDSDRVEAIFKDGILRINLPKSAKALEQTKKIRVRRR